MRFIGIILSVVAALVITAHESAYGAMPIVRDSISEGIEPSHRRTYRHSEAVQRFAIHRDTTTARNIWQELIAEDSTYAPAHYYLSLSSPTDRRRALHHAERAYKIDSSNKWYVNNYGSLLLTLGQYHKALPIYRHLMSLDNRDLATYHALALLYGIEGMPYSAISILDSAELRMGRNSVLSMLKQNLLLDTRQYARVIKEGEQLVSELPYDIDICINLAQAYEASGQDSLATATYERAFRIDSTNLNTLEEIAEYHARRGNHRQMLDYIERLLADERYDVARKIEYIDRLTTNTDFYRNNFFRLGGIIMKLAVDYPNDKPVVERYATHLLAAGSDDEALELLRRNLNHPTTIADDYIAVIQLEELMGRTEEMAIDLAAAQARFADDVNIILYTAYNTMQQGDYATAIKGLKRGVKFAENDIERSQIWGMIGDIYHEDKCDSKSFKAYDKALGYNADNVAVLNNYAYFLSLLDKDLERAEAMAKRATELERGNATYIDTYAWVLHRLGRNSEAKTLMRQALSLDGQRDPDILAHYGDILWSLGEKFMAETYWKKAVEKGYDSDKMAEHILTITQQ